MKLVVNAPANTTAHVASSNIDLDTLKGCVFSAISNGFEVSIDKGQVKAFKGKMIDKSYTRMNVMFSTLAADSIRVTVLVTKQVSKGSNESPVLIDMSFQGPVNKIEKAFQDNFTETEFNVVGFQAAIDAPKVTTETAEAPAQTPKATQTPKNAANKPSKK
jgi:hypothetical protein